MKATISLLSSTALLRTCSPALQSSQSATLIPRGYAHDNDHTNTSTTTTTTTTTTSIITTTTTTTTTTYNNNSSNNNNINTTTTNDTNGNTAIVLPALCL